MAFCTVLSASVQGLGVEMIRVEADVSNGLPMFHMVGYLSSEVKEASERVRTAIRNSGMKLPAKKIIVNLAPATVRKKGASFDLPIALAVLAAMGLYTGRSNGTGDRNRGIESGGENKRCTGSSADGDRGERTRM